jgi:hypothetical protein
VAIPRYYGTVQREGRDGWDLGLVSQLVEGATLEEEVTKGAWDLVFVNFVLEYEKIS